MVTAVASSACVPPKSFENTSADPAAFSFTRKASSSARATRGLPGKSSESVPPRSATASRAARWQGAAGEVVRERATGQVGAAGAVHGDTVSEVAFHPAEVRGVEELSGSAEFRDAGVGPARERGLERVGDREIGRAGGS